MVIGSVGGSNGSQSLQPGAAGGRQQDPVAKGIQEQINRAQKEMQELNGNQELSPERKQKRRQELQQEISDLNMQLRQHEIEEKKKEREEKQQSDNPLGLPEYSEHARSDSRPGVEMGISAAGMEALISADNAGKAAAVQGSVAQHMEGKANVLEVEIQLDAGRNGDTTVKQEQLAEVRQKAQAAQAAQLSTLQEAGEALKDAFDAESVGAAKEEEKDGDSLGAEEENGVRDAGQSDGAVQQSDEAVQEQVGGYAPVDVRV